MPSKNNFLFALLTLGEGWHNNHHHHYPSSARQGFKWWEIDISHYVIQCMAFLRMVWDVHPVPKSVLEDNLIEKNRDDT